MNEIVSLLNELPIVYGLNLAGFLHGIHLAVQRYKLLSLLDRAITEAMKCCFDGLLD